MTEPIAPIWVADTLDLAQGPLRARRRYSLAVDRATEPPSPHVAIEVLVGRRHRPVLALVAGIHGDEYDGILALQELAREIEPETLDGTLAIAPVANPFAFAAGQRRTPDDDADLNRVFPGRADGTLSERLADRLCQRLLRQADMIFTLHGATSTGYLSPWVEYLNEATPVGEATFAIARATGIPHLIALDNLPGRLQRTIANLGVPLVEAEVGGRGATRRENVTYYKERALNVARHAGLLPPAVVGEPAAAQTIWRLGSVAAEAEGIFLREVELNAVVRSGDGLGRIVDRAGEVVAEVRAPEDGMIGGYRDHAGVRPGDPLFNLWLRAEQIGPGRQPRASFAR
jgi:predicted deacylase